MSKDGFHQLLSSLADLSLHGSVRSVSVETLLERINWSLVLLWCTWRCCFAQRSSDCLSLWHLHGECWLLSRIDIERWLVDGWIPSGSGKGHWEAVFHLVLGAAVWSQGIDYTTHPVADTKMWYVPALPGIDIEHSNRQKMFAFCSEERNKNNHIYLIVSLMACLYVTYVLSIILYHYCNIPFRMTEAMVYATWDGIH